MTRHDQALCAALSDFQNAAVLTQLAKRWYSAMFFFAD
ncbi:hypothetical protein BLL52_1350 [Rhodoferax antarcticus ANT.BR]|uniref:Uncharacterized protein n=1 Tax=Rhodoferax antarcticus ANT.BR TaxID=1111071 RepID=A0A1Q8YHZ5_9BURK|nr:hypothetical protein BLL52_1350 [Rhodoferax antarcticus ANT.BR]